MRLWRHSTFIRPGAAAPLGCLAVALLATLVASGGCSPSTPASNRAPAAAASRGDRASHRPPSPNDDASDDAGAPARPQKVNIFGEVNGAPANNAATSAEAAFQQHTFTDEGFDGDVTVDPTGKWLAFSSTRNSEHPSIYLQRVDGSTVTQLTDGNSDDAHPTFSPDGRQVAFSSTRPGNWQIFLMDVDGHNVTQVTSGPTQAIHPSFSPDGTRLVYCGLGARSGQWELWTVDLKSAERRMIGYGVFPVWSPDKSIDRIAFQRARQRGSRWFSLWTLDLINGEGRRATEVAVSANAAILSPTWSPDGKRLAFATIVQPGKGGAGRPSGQTDIWTIEADGTARQRLTDGRGANLMPCWAPDNRVYFVSNRGGAECIWSVRTEPSKQQAVADAKKGDRAVKEEKKEPSEIGATDATEVAPH